MELRRENMHKLAVHSLLVNIICNKVTDIVLPCAGRAVQGENQGLLGIVVAHKAMHRIQDDARCDVLSKQLAVQVVFQT